MHKRLYIPLTILFIISLALGCSIVSTTFVPEPTSNVPTQASTITTERKFVLAGGGLNSNQDQIYEKIIQLAGGPDKARIGIITAAEDPSEENDNYGFDTTRCPDNFSQISDTIHTECIPIDINTLQNNSSPEVIRQINSMTGFFFGGGQQTQLIASFYLANRTPSPALMAIREKYEQGAVIAGSSAGAAVMVGTAMLTPGGESYEAFRYGTFTNPVKKANYMYYDPQGGFNFFSYGMIDTHFSERGRQGRLIRVGLDTGQQRGFGIDEGTALVVTNADTPDARMQVIGEGGVTIVDLSQVKVTNERYTGAYGVRMTYLTQDDTYFPATNTVTFAPWKTSQIPQKEFSAKRMTSHDIFSSPDNDRDGARAFANLAIRLFRSSATQVTATTYESRPRYTVKMTEDTSAGTIAYYGEQDMEDFYSYKNLIVDIYVE